MRSSNENNQNKIYIDEAGRRKIEAAIDEIQKRIIVNNKSKKDHYYEEGREDGHWYSSGLYEKVCNDKVLTEQIHNLRKMLQNAEIIERGDNQDLIDIDDTVRIAVSSNDSEDEMIIKLVGSMTDIDQAVLEVSINSPLGKAIYHKKVADSFTYLVSEAFPIENSYENKVTILEKIDKTEVNTRVRN